MKFETSLDGWKQITFSMILISFGMFSLQNYERSRMKSTFLVFKSRESEESFLIWKRTCFSGLLSQDTLWNCFPPKRKIGISDIHKNPKNLLGYRNYFLVFELIESTLIIFKENISYRFGIRKLKNQTIRSKRMMGWKLLFLSRELLFTREKDHHHHHDQIGHTTKKAFKI